MRRSKRGQKGKERRKKILHFKHTSQPKKKPAFQKVSNMGRVPWGERIRFYIYKVARMLRRVGCFIGIHDWRICSGRKGDSMFACIRCWAGSKTKWGEGGSEKHYGEKHKDKVGIADPENWEEKDGGYYFKGQHVELTKEEVRRLKVILKRKNELPKSKKDN